MPKNNSPNILPSASHLFLCPTEGTRGLSLFLDRGLFTVLLAPTHHLFVLSLCPVLGKLRVEEV